jgi:hypothetical protein
MPARHALLACVLAATPLASAASQEAPASAWANFVKLPAAQQHTLLEALQRDVPSHPLLRSARVCGATVSPRKAAPGTKPPVGAPQPMPLRVVYCFGDHAVVPRPVAGSAFAKVTKAAAKPKPQAGTQARDPILVQHTLLGCPPDADLALAALLQRLDTDAHLDAFASFLERWQHGDEPFYAALDRTAGQADGLLYLDAMLDDFVASCGGAHAAELRQSHDQAQAALHRAFLAYRQYRGLREAIAWSALLPADVPLPAHLARYEAVDPKGYSLRQQVVMVLAALDHDLERLVAAVNAVAPPLPSPLWQGRYEPMAAWQQIVTCLQPKMLAEVRSTDEFLAHVLAERRVLALRLREIAGTRLAGKAATPAPRTGSRRN